MTISDFCKRQGLAASIYCKWSKEFIEAGKNGLTRSIICEVKSDEVRRIKGEKAAAELALDIIRYKKV